MQPWEPGPPIDGATRDEEPACCIAGLLPDAPSLLTVTPTPPIFGAGLKILPANFSGFALAPFAAFLF